MLNSKEDISKNMGNHITPTTPFVVTIAFWWTLILSWYIFIKARGKKCVNDLGLGN